MQMFPGMTGPAAGAPADTPAAGGTSDSASVIPVTEAGQPASSGAGVSAQPSAKRRKKDTLVGAQEDLNTYAAEATGV